LQPAHPILVVLRQFGEPQTFRGLGTTLLLVGDDVGPIISTSSEMGELSFSSVAPEARAELA
jgi:hypothetical protein